MASTGDPQSATSRFAPKQQPPPPHQRLRMKPTSNVRGASKSMRSWRTTAVALALAFWIHLYNQFAPFDSYLPPTEINHDVEKHFSSTYYEARALFRQQANAANAKLLTLPLEHLAHLDLTIDVAVIQGAHDKAVLHISGTHGVEGFAGSSIQSVLLERLANASEATTSDSPTLIFVHALNPYGMAMLRRFNEHNVDLNRNFMTPDGFKQRLAKDPNAYGYVDLLEALNPPRPTKRLAWLASWAQMIQYAFHHGVASIKRATVAGNAHFPKTIFYGGNELEPSGRLLHQMLREQLDFEQLKVLGVIDVHTGLGPAGYDTIMLDTVGDAAPLQGIFGGRRPVLSGDNSDDAASGYEGTTGLMCSGFTWLLPAHVDTICVTQEFGTLAGPFVLTAMIQENAMFHHAPSRRLPYAEQLRDAFYVHRSVKWKNDIVSRGVVVWDELETHVYGGGDSSTEAQ